MYYYINFVSKANHILDHLAHTLLQLGVGDKKHEVPHHANLWRGCQHK